MDITQSPTAIIIFIGTIAVSLYAMYRDHSLFPKFLLSPFRINHNNEWYRFISSGFIHADWMHLGFNMLTFYFFAFHYEAIVGPWQFLIIYMGSMVLADVTTYLKHKDNPDYAALGASGAISGMLFSFIFYRPDMSIMIMFIPIPIPAPVFAVLYLVYCWYAGKKSQDNINHDAHMWGALAGVILTAILDFSIIKGFFQFVF